MNRVDRKPDIARAVRRSRSARAALRSRRRRRAALAGVLAVALAGAGTLSLDAMTGGDVVHAAVSQAQSLADLLNGRSPGQRTQAELTKTKHARALPKARAAAKPAFPSKPDMAEIAHLLAPPEPALVNAAPLAPLAFGPKPSLGDIVVPPGGGGGPGGPTPPGGGGGGVIIPNPPGENPPPPPPPPPVPEPATWAMMLLGFGLVGWRLRGGKRRTAKTLTA
jgi:hypothetical protein